MAHISVQIPVIEIGEAVGAIRTLADLGTRLTRESGKPNYRIMTYHPRRLEGLFSDLIRALDSDIHTTDPSTLTNNPKRRKREIKEVFSRLDKETLDTITSGRTDKVTTIPTNKMFVMSEELDLIKTMQSDTRELAENGTTKANILNFIKVNLNKLTKDDVYARLETLLSNLILLSQGRIGRNLLNKKTVTEALNALNDKIGQEDSTKRLPARLNRPNIELPVNTIRETKGNTTRYTMMISIPIISQAVRHSYQLKKKKFLFTYSGHSYQLTVEDWDGVNLIAPDRLGHSGVQMTSKEFHNCYLQTGITYCRIRAITTKMQESCIFSLYFFNQVGIANHCKITVEKLAGTAIIDLENNGYQILSPDTKTITCQGKNTTKHKTLKGQQTYSFKLTRDCNKVYSDNFLLERDSTGLGKSHTNMSFNTQGLVEYIFRNYPQGIHREFTDGQTLGLDNFNDAPWSFSFEENVNIAMSSICTFAIAIILNLAKLLTQHLIQKHRSKPPSREYRHPRYQPPDYAK